jgi:hypothetical protein
MTARCDGMAVQLCGPVSGIDYGSACAAFAEAKAALVEAGARSVWSPTERVPPSATHEQAMRRCIDRLVVAAPGYVLVTLPGWLASDGARLEVAVAKTIGLRVMSLEDALADDGELGTGPMGGQ